MRLKSRWRLSILPSACRVEKGKRVAQKTFSLSVKVIVCDREGRCLLLKRSAASAGNAGKWDFPGGKLDPGERIDQATFDYLLADAEWARRHKPDDPRAQPKRRGELGKMEPITP